MSIWLPKIQVLNHSDLFSRWLPTVYFRRLQPFIDWNKCLMSVFRFFYKLYKWYQVVQPITYTSYGFWCVCRETVVTILSISPPSSPPPHVAIKQLQTKLLTCKILPNNFKYDYLNVLAIQVDFCFQELYFEI